MSDLNNSFDPYDIEQKDMDTLADIIERYLDQLQEVMIIPKEIEDKYGNSIRKSIEASRKLIKKLRKGDVSVFKDPEEWERYSII